jgi:hypothetical protein
MPRGPKGEKRPAVTDEETEVMTIPASNKPIEMPACQIMRVVDGKLQSTSHYFDMLTMLTQIGVTGPRNAGA